MSSVVVVVVVVVVVEFREELIVNGWDVVPVTDALSGSRLKSSFPAACTCMWL